MFSFPNFSMYLLKVFSPFKTVFKIADISRSLIPFVIFKTSGDQLKGGVLNKKRDILSL